MSKRIAPRPIKRILVANRGEIAVRILSTCRELNLETYALYTDDDVSHTYNARHAIRLSSPADYMSVDALLKVVRDNGIDAVHPGYGFLSESAELAARLAEQNVMVVGPGAENLARTGDKLAAKELALQCGVPVLEACTAGGVGEVEAFVKKVGLPVMIKAVDGGGGRGIRLVRKMEEMKNLVARAVEESASRKVFAERAAVDGFRHVEVQILGDGEGGVRHLWERECSIQRRYQKIVEVAPSMCKDREVVNKVVEAAVKMAKEVRYASLGTWEFLVNPNSGEFFFLEINPRLQVEHTITESISGLDIVKAQLRLAQGASLDEAGVGKTSQDALTPPGQYAIQLRVTAEDVAKNYQLSIGKIQSFNFPSGSGIRVDTALLHHAPAIVSADFDSVVAKLIITAPTWPDAVTKARRALQDTFVTGIQTNISLLRAIVSHEAFLEGACDTQWLESNHSTLLALSQKPQFQDPQDPLHGLVKPQTSSNIASAGGSGGPLFKKDDAWKLALTRHGDKKEQQNHLQLTKVLKNSFPASLSADILFTNSGSEPVPYTLTLTSTSASAAASSSSHPYGDPNDKSHVLLPLSGKLVEVLVDEGDFVKKDEAVCVVRQMKMEVEVRAHRAGVVSWVTEAEDGEDVAEGMLAAVVLEEEKENRAKL